MANWSQKPGLQVAQNHYSLNFLSVTLGLLIVSALLLNRGNWGEEWSVELIGYNKIDLLSDFD